MNKRPYKPRPKTPKGVYITQRENARRRGIDFLFTFEQWVKWWTKRLGPDWFSKRGRHANEYVMARKGDKGPYAVWNVVCVTASRNCADMVANGSLPIEARHPMAKLTEKQVIELYFNPDTRQAARRAGVPTSVAYKIKRKQIWKHVTANLEPPPYKQTGRGARTDLRSPTQ